MVIIVVVVVVVVVIVDVVMVVVVVIFDVVCLLTKPVRLSAFMGDDVCHQWWYITVPYIA